MSAAEGATTAQQGFSELMRPTEPHHLPPPTDSLSPPQLRNPEEMSSPAGSSQSTDGPKSAVYRAEARVFPNDRASQIYNELEQKLRADGVSTDHVVDMMDEAAHNRSTDNISYTKSEAPSNLSAEHEIERDSESPDLTSPLVMADQREESSAPPPQSPEEGDPDTPMEEDMGHNSSMYDDDVRSNESYTPPSSVGTFPNNPSPGSTLSPRGPAGSPWSMDYPGFPSAGFPHMTIEQGKEIYYCHLCSYSGNSKFHFNSHMNSHFEHRCPHCDYTSRTEGRLKRHIKDFHTDDPPENFSGQPRHVVRTPGRPKVFRCKQCDYSTADKVEFWEHSRKHIKADKVLQCPKCPFVTEYKHHLEYHLRNHFGSKPFKCPKCNYSCVNKSMLNSHLKSHSNIYQYRCADCTYATKYCHSLKLHLRKYSHKPSTVLTTDGSLPMDGSGDFNLVAKRGPPRGPRGVKQENAGHPSMPIPPAAMMNKNLPGMMLPHRFPPGIMPPFWNMMHGMAPPPLIPVQGMMPDDKMLARMAAGLPLKCHVCDYTSDTREGLTEHMLKVHAAAENSDLLRMFNLTVEDARKAAEMAFKSGDDRPKMPSPRDANSAPMLSPYSMYRSPETGRQGFNVGMGGLSTDLQSLARMTEQLTDSRRPGPMQVPRPMAPAMQQSPAASQPQAQRTSGEAPLDLTAKRDDEDMNDGKHHSESHNEQREDDLSEPLDDSRDDESSRGGESGEHFAAHMLGLEGASGMNGDGGRKRSRKGKAYKLDALCLRLQERSTNPDSGDEASASQTNPSDTNTWHAPGDDAIDYSEIHNSLSQLNEESTEAREKFGFPTRTTPSIRGPLALKQASDARQTYPDHRKSLIMRHQEGDTSPQGDGDKPSPPADASRPQSNGHPEAQPPRSQLSEMQAHNHDSMMAAMMAQQQAEMQAMVARGDASANLQMLLASKFPHGMHPVKNGGRYECSFCHIAFLDCVMYTMHMGYHSNRDPFRCNMCGHHTKDKVEFFLHIARAAHA